MLTHVRKCYGPRSKEQRTTLSLSEDYLPIYCDDYADFPSIVFVHGLRGSRHGTWTKDGVFWPQDILPKDHPRARVLTVSSTKTHRRQRLTKHTQWGYDADVFRFFEGVGTGNINDHSKRLLNDLSRVRFESRETERPLIFIAHSLGGLIVKDVCTSSLSPFLSNVDD